MSRVSFHQDAKGANGDSPLKPSSGIHQHTNTAHTLPERRHAQLINMHGKSFLVGDYDKFMDKFFGPRHAPPQATSNLRRKPDVDRFAKVPSPRKEDKKMYKNIVDAVNGSGLCPKYVCISHPDKSGNGESAVRSVDMGLYVRGKPRDKPSPGRVRWGFIDLPIEGKPPDDTQRHDPFPGPPGDEPRTDSEKDTLGQILTYAELIFRHQQRTFFFMLVIIGNEARILRIDRSAIFFSERFTWNVKNSKLSDFLRRYEALSDVERGWDATAERVKPGSTLHDAMIKAGKKREEEEEKYHDARDMFRKSLDKKYAWWKLKVPDTTKQEPAPQTPLDGLPDDERDARPHYKTFLVGKPHFFAPGVLGRGTRGYVALPVDGETVGDRFYYLKDAWRVDHPEIEQEGSILHELNEAKVQFVPTLYTHGDLPGKEQVTDWRTFRADIRPTIAKEDCRLKRHQHYRLVVKEVCKPLHEFGATSQELITFIVFCLQAHKEAFEKGIIHRDISAGNLLIYQDPETGDRSGVLNDWELAKRFGPGISSKKRQPHRTGTLQYMSVHALNKPGREITLEDELESILHVIIYIAVRFVHSNLGPENAGRFLHNYFDEFGDNGREMTCGETKYMCIKHGRIDLSTYSSSDEDKQLRFLWPKKAETPTEDAEDDGHDDDDENRSEDEIESEDDSEDEIGSEDDSEDEIEGEDDEIEGEDDSEDEIEPNNASSQPAEEDRAHPLTHIIRTLLSWFKALYALDDICTTEPSLKPQDGKELENVVRRPNMKRFTPNVSRRSTITPASTLSPEEEARNKTLRENLASHDCFIALLNDLAEKDAVWPADDRVDDKKPAKGYNSRCPTQTQTGSAFASSSKRTREDDEERSTASKRSRR